MKDKQLKIIIGIVILLIITLGFVMIKIIKTNSECTANPLVYGAKKVSEGDITIMCTCNMKDNVDDSRFNPFWFDNETIEVIKEERDFNYTYII